MRTMNISGSVLLAAVLLLTGVLVSVPSEAQVTGPCAETVNKYCKDVAPGEGRIMKCLSDHRDDQSMACKDWLQEQNKSLKELNTACPEEIFNLCSSAASDGIRLFRCLEGNYFALKSNCREKLREIKDRLQ